MVAEMGPASVTGLRVVRRRVIVRKVHREASTASAVIYDYKSTVVTEGVVADRWVLVVQDASDAEHYVNVAPQVWEGHQVGDVITAEDPLINLP